MGLFNQINQQLIQELQKKSKRNTAEDMSMGGVEPPVLMTANDMAEELEGLPRSFVEAALDPLDTGAVNEILEGLRRQGDEVAVAIDRRSEFEKPSAQSLIDAMQKIDLVDNNGNSHIVYTSQSQMDVYSRLVHDQEKSLLFGSPEKKPVLESHRMVVTDLTQDYVRRHDDMIMSAGMAIGVNPAMFDIPGSEK
jgi:hypothetical protein